MANHNHNTPCECEEHRHLQDSGRQRSFYLKWLFSILFVFVSFYILKPFLVKQLVNRGATYMSYSMYDEAIRQYKKAIFFDKENSDIHTFLAYAYRSKNDIVQAKLAYQKAIKLNPKNKLALLDLGIMYFKEKNYKVAIEYFNSIIELGPEDQKEIAFNLISFHRSALSMLAACHKSLNHIVEEKMTLQKLLRFYPDDQDAKKRLSELE